MRGPVFLVLALVSLVVLAGSYAAWRVRCRINRQTRLSQIRRCCLHGDRLQESIFVSVPSYRDNDTARTLLDIYEQAACPQRVFVGLCVQNAPRDRDPMEEYAQLADRSTSLGNFSDQIRVWSMDSLKARGPMFARAKIEQNLHRNERFYMNIDSHTRFAKNWDTRVVDYWKECGTPRAVLTAYPPESTERDGPEFRGSFLRPTKRDDDTGILLQEGPFFAVQPETVVPTALWAGCFSFAPSAVVAEVPYDDQCPYVFFGEEQSRALRLWTSGWDLFHPPKNVVSHRWSRAARPTFWELLDGSSAAREERRNGYDRLHAVLRDEVPPPYGLGQVRSLAAYEAFADISFHRHEAGPRGKRGLTEGASLEERAAKEAP